jgi:hypothetical protein
MTFFSLFLFWLGVGLRRGPISLSLSLSLSVCVWVCVSQSVNPAALSIREEEPSLNLS